MELAFDELNCKGILLTDIEVAQVRESIEKLYAVKKGSFLPLWERLIQEQSIHDPNGWKVIENYHCDGEVIMFFDQPCERTMFRFNSIEDVVMVLNESPGFVFYLTDDNFSFLICQNDHDYLIGSGRAASWVASL